ncbi:hypothetical protein H4Q26_016802 [Puccinia striiformis f. sp. tritici PST-130]|nr:hypothetical protein H4Q26_016802 [Puccinia striiformis f. sp. tritici PST-130]
MPFHYELVVARLCEEDAGQSQSQNVLENKHEKAFLLAEALHFQVDEGVDGSNEEIPTIRFSWLDVLSPISERFEFVISSQHTGCSRSDIEQVQDIIVQCIWEGENEKYSSEAPEEELLAIKQAFNIPHPQADITHPTSPPDTEKPPPLHLVKQSNKVIWVDIGINLEETYWWPALVYESNLRVDINPKLLESIKATKPFKAHLLFDPVELNPIFKTEGLAGKYPTKTSFNEAYLIAREKYVIYSFQEDNEELPDVSAFMIPLSQESRAVLSNIFSREEINKNRPASPELDNLNNEVCDEPDQEIEIPGEIVLCQSNGESQEFWPARVVSYAGLQSFKSGRITQKPTFKSEKTYRLQFFDHNFIIAPRSSFWTTDQEEFYRVRMGQIHTCRTKFKHMSPLIEKELPHLDRIVNQKSSDPILISKHENFLTSVKNRGLIPEDVRYGKYCEDTLHEVGMFLRDRYLLNNRLESEEGRIIAMDPRFSALSEADKTQYIFDILVPELIRLITVTQYLEDRREELISELGGSSREELEKDELMNQKILEEAKKLAHLDICEVDLVDKVISFRTQNLSSNLPTPTPSASSSIDFAKDGNPQNHLLSNSSSKLVSLDCSQSPSSSKPS